MIENRLELNKKPVYELPDNTIIKTWFSAIPNRKQPNFKPDLILSMFMNSNEIKVNDGGSQMWIKSDNIKLLEFIRGYDFNKKDLINFIKTYNFNTSKSISGNNNLSVTILKKIILEEFYGVKDRE